MVFVRKFNGVWQVCRSNSKKKPFERVKDIELKDWWLIKNQTPSGGGIHLGHIYFPKKFIGKKVRLIVEEKQEGEKNE